MEVKMEVEMEEGQEKEGNNHEKIDQTSESYLLSPATENSNFIS